jgi:hypothetical protein
MKSISFLLVLVFAFQLSKSQNNSSDWIKSSLIAYPLNIAYNECKIGFELPISLKSMMEFAPSLVAKNTYKSEVFGFGADINWRYFVGSRTIKNNLSVGTFIGIEGFYRYHQDAVWDWYFPDLRTHYIANQGALSFNFLMLRFKNKRYFLDFGLGAGLSKSIFNNYNAEVWLDGFNGWAGHTGPFMRTRVAFGFNLRE